METTAYTEKELHELTREELIELYLDQKKQLSQLSETIALLRQLRYGRKSEKASADPNQYTMDFETGEFVLNEAEAIEDENPETPEPGVETVVKKRPVRKKGSREVIFGDLPRRDVVHELSAEELSRLFPGGYRRLPDETYSELDLHPENFEVLDHHVAVYAANGEDRIVRADRPVRLFAHSMATPGLVADIITNKFMLGLPYSRISTLYRMSGADIPGQSLARWCIMASDMYLHEIYDEMHRDMVMNSKLIHADESPFRVTEEMKERGPDSKCYMWVYHTDTAYGSHPIFLYEYCPTRKAENPEKFLEGYSGILMTDGYQAYHRLEADHPGELKVAGCWAHAKRRFKALIKSDRKRFAKGTTAYEAHARIQAIYHADNMYKDLGNAERLKMRQANVKPLVDAFFEYLKNRQPMLDSSSETGRAVNYCLNQEKYLRVFLTDGMVPLDNNDAERSIRTFCVGRANWHLVNSKSGAKASGICLSITETAKANGLNVQKYIKYVLEQLSQKTGVHTHGFIKKLLPWSEALPEELHINSKD